MFAPSRRPAPPRLLGYFELGPAFHNRIYDLVVVAGWPVADGGVRCLVHVNHATQRVEVSRHVSKARRVALAQCVLTRRCCPARFSPARRVALRP